jgi:F-type H+-transporting ATPase subunit b
MQIDWVTVGAQVVNFLVLVFLLQHFLYRPVLEAMARREKRIAERLNEAAEREQTAQRKADDYEQRVAGIDKRRDALVAEAEEQAAAQRRDLLDRARAEVEQAEARWRQDLRREQHEFLGEVRREIAAAAQSVARKALADLADAELEKRMLDKLLGAIEQLDDRARTALASAKHGITVRTAFALDSAQRGQTTRALHERLGPDTPVHYAQDEALLCGITLEGGDHRLGWCLADYLEGLEERLSNRLAALDTAPEQQASGETPEVKA